MVTGIEIAGITLGAFPVAVEALKFYASSAQTFNNLRRHRQVLESFDMVSSDKLKRLMDQPGGPQWKAQEFQDMLISQLRKNTVGYFVSTVEELRAAVADVIENYEHKTPDKEPIIERLRGMTLAALTDYRKGRIEEVHKLNGDLARLISGSQPTNFGQPSKSTARLAVEYYRRIRRHAILLHDVLNDQFLAQACGPVPHCAKLQLDVRRIEALQMYTSSNGFGTGPSPHRYFKLPTSRRKLSPQPPLNHPQPVIQHKKAAVFNIPTDNIESTSSSSKPPLFPATTKIIKNLCTTLVNLDAGSSCNCLGLLVDSKQRKHRVWLPRNTYSPTYWRNSHPPFSPQPIPAIKTRKERLRLGVKLASSVMQLHDTVWLDES
ncbi:hypothetical protein BDD12DRAFT_893069 [Trichophaea hybrida]|nr:hypothetical protein BDD12DRAFT_893069 [Trichophaea hybrida]